MLEDNVLITGGAGYLGRGIMRQARRGDWPAKFIIYSRDEQVQAECRRKFPEARYVLGDVRDTDRLALIMTNVKYVVHAAAIKFIPEAEANASECVSVNVDGARSVIAAARTAGVYRVVGISTDKAAAPINIYGMTKAVMERLFADANVSHRRPIFTTCRYGNVIGSTGSVVPVWRQALEDGNAITITDPYMTRFWMPVDYAVSVILAAFEARPGSVVLPNPTAANMHQIAHAVLEDDDCTWGAVNPDRVPCHPRIRYSHPRPGEKKDEDMVTAYERARILPYGQHFYELLPSGAAHVGHVDLPHFTSVASNTTSFDTLVSWIKDSVTV